MRLSDGVTYYCTRTIELFANLVTLAVLHITNFCYLPYSQHDRKLVTGEKNFREISSKPKIIFIPPYISTVNKLINTSDLQ